MTTKTFGNRKQQDVTFTVNDVPFTARLLSLEEEAALAAISLEGLDSDSLEELRGTMTSMAEAVAGLLQARVQDQTLKVDVNWVMENLTVSDLEGIVEYLRTGEVTGE